MKCFNLKPIIHKFDSFEDFSGQFELCKDDLILTHQFIYEPFMKNLNLECGFIFQEKYGTGEPSDEMADKILADIKGKSYKRIIAVGGGTVIDIAKLFVLKDVNQTIDAFEKCIPLIKDKELIIIPTTCGTGSEVTNLSIFEIKARHTKMGLGIDELYADHAVLIPKLVESLPYKFFVYSSVDALIHAFEAYVSPKSNCYTELFSLGAIEKIFRGYISMIRNGIESRNDVIEDILTASNFAGIAFGNAGVGAVHALSYPLGAGYHVPHGEANYIFFLEVFRTYNKNNPLGKIKYINDIIRKELCLDAGEDAYKGLEELLSELLPIKRLREYGMKEAEIEAFADNVIANQQRLLVNNYVPLSKDEIIDIYRNLF
jgi:4-hydroxybutyrate dehydrogenase